MNEGDRKNFSQAIGQLMAIYADSVTPAVLNAWWGALQPYQFKDVAAGMNRHAIDPKAGMFRPTPAHVIGHIEQIEAERAMAIAKLMRSVQPSIDALEDQMYRALHDARMDRMADSEARRIADDCRQQIEQIRRGLSAQITATRKEIGYVD